MDKTISLAALSCAVTLCLSSPSFAKIGQLGSQANPQHNAQEYQSTQEALQNAKQHFVRKRFDLAFLELLPLAQQGNADAQYGVGYLYYYGKGTPTDHDKGVYWIRQSAAQGFTNAQKALQMLNLANTDAQPKAIPQAKIQVKAPLAKQAQRQERRALKTSFQERARKQHIAIQEDDLTSELEGSIFGEELTSDLLIDDFSDQGIEARIKPSNPAAKQVEPQAKSKQNSQATEGENQKAQNFSNFFQRLAQAQQAQKQAEKTQAQAAVKADAKQAPEKVAANKPATVTTKNLAQAETIAKKDNAKIINNASLAANTNNTAPVTTGILSKKTKSVDVELIQRAGSIVTYGPTRQIDTLWSIAKAVRPNKSVSIQQMMLSILEANPKAFNEPNINALKENVILKIPDLSKIEDLDKNQSLAQAQQHELDWIDNI